VIGRTRGAPAPRVLLCTTNGIGLGHLTRAMAIGRRLPSPLTPVVFTTSQAVPVVREQGFLVEHLPSPGAVPLDAMDWELLYQQRLAHLLATYDPAVVLFDGVHPYLGFLMATRRRSQRHRRVVWCRRGMWQPGLGATALARSVHFDAILEPGDLASPADRGLTAAVEDGAHRVDPVLLCDPAEQRSRAEACRALGLDPAARWALVQLGGGAAGDPSSPLGAALAALRAIPGLRVAVAESTLVPPRDDLPDDVARIRRYPLAPDLSAFDVVLTAAGYNTFHECLAAAAPTVLVPAERNRDDQHARARFAAAHGLARCWEERTVDSLRAHVEALLDPEGATAVRSRLAGWARPNGAVAAARLLAEQARATGAAGLDDAGARVADASREGPACGR